MEENQSIQLPPTPVNIMMTGSIITECKRPFTFVNIISFTLVSTYAILTLIKLRKTLGFHFKMIGTMMIIILSCRLCVYVYIPFFSTYCETFFSFCNGESCYTHNLDKIIDLNTYSWFGDLMNTIFMSILYHFNFRLIRYWCEASHDQISKIYL